MLNAIYIFINIIVDKYPNNYIYLLFKRQLNFLKEIIIIFFLRNRQILSIIFFFLKKRFLFLFFLISKNYYKFKITIQSRSRSSKHTLICTLNSVLLQRTERDNGFKNGGERFSSMLWQQEICRRNDLIWPLCQLGSSY